MGHIRSLAASKRARGGIAVGAVLGRIADMQWMQIAIKPAKPFALPRWSSV